MNKQEISEDTINSKTISQLGLRLSSKKINADACPEARVFEYPHLTNVFIMENDLYGNKMPDGSCFLAFYGKHGLIGKHLSVKKLINSSREEIKNLVACNNEG